MFKLRKRDVPKPRAQPKAAPKASWLPLLATDHAFANGPVFTRPASLTHACDMLEGDETAAELLVAVFEQFDRNAMTAPGLRLALSARLINLDARESVTIGTDTVIRGILRNERGGRLALGERIYVGDNVLLSAAASLTIGDGTLIAHGVQIFDNDSHPIDVAERDSHFRAILGDKSGKPYHIGNAPVSVGRMAWVGLNSIVMKGVTIGDQSIIAAGSVVTGNVAPNTVAGGNPAVTVKQLNAD